MRERVQRHAADIGTGPRLAGEAEEKPWPLSPVPLLIDADEWRHLAAGIAQRAELIAWYERRGYVRTGETRPFPYGDERFGRPLRDDLHFVVLEKALA